MVANIFLAFAAAFAACAAQDAAETAEEPRLIGYYDAKFQREYPVNLVPHENLTHVVITNGVKVDSSGKLHTRPKKFPWEKSAEELIQHLAAQPTGLIVSVRGFPDDVMLDQLAETEAARARFAEALARRAFFWGAKGVEIEWHADDLAGGKAMDAGFDDKEQMHFGLLCAALAEQLRPRGLTLSVATRPGRQEFASGQTVQDYLDWLMVRAYSMRSLGDPHHSSMKDVKTALGEWLDRGVPASQLVLGTPLFARAGGALRRERSNDGARLPWHQVHAGDNITGSDPLGDVFSDAGSGRLWWASGLRTTAEKVKHALEGGFRGVGFRDLHHDARGDTSKSLVQAAAEVAQEARQRKEEPALANPISLIQKAIRSSRMTATLKENHADL